MIKKQYLKKRTICKVTFTLPENIEAQAASVVGDLNNWNPSAHPMKRVRNGRLQTAVELEPGREYQFRYLVNDQAWYNDDQADRYVPNAYGGENSVIAT